MKANPQDQRNYSLIVTQALSFAAKNGAQLESMIKTNGPVKGLIGFLNMTMNGIGQSAQKAGAQVQGHTVMKALQEIVTVLVTMMKSGGLVEDVPGTIQQVMGGLQNGAA